MTGSSGGDDATTSDQINALGNHLGRELLRLDWERETFSLVFQHDKPFEDASGLRFQNFPDGVNTLHFSFNDKSKWISDIVLEYVYTKWQSGTRHDRPATEEELRKNPDKTRYIVGGCDSYFTNGEYKSGWTYNGRVIGLPLFPAKAKNADGQTFGVSSNRITGWNFGLGGSIAHKLPYTLKITYSRQFGIYYQTAGTIYESKPRQVSGAFEVQMPKLRHRAAPVVLIGCYADKGSLLPDTAGVTLTLRWGK